METMGSIGPNLTEEVDGIEQNLDADMGSGEVTIETIANDPLVGGEVLYCCQKLYWRKDQPTIL